MVQLGLLIIDLLDIYIWIIIANAAFSWLIHFGIVNLTNKYIAMVALILDKFTRPLLQPIQRFMPNLGGLDLSPIILILGVFVVQSLVALVFIQPNI